jgi:hypothetical protein
MIARASRVRLEVRERRTHCCPATKESEYHFNSVSTTRSKQHLTLVVRRCFPLSSATWTSRFQFANSSKNRKFDLKHISLLPKLGSKDFPSGFSPAFNAIASDSGENHATANERYLSRASFSVLLWTRVKCQTEIDTFRSTED